MALAHTKITVGCLFSGMGGFASGLAKAGFEIRWASDNDSSASDVFRHRFPNVTFLEKDVRNLSVGADRLSEVDVLAAGFPLPELFPSRWPSGSRGSPRQTVLRNTAVAIRIRTCSTASLDHLGECTVFDVRCWKSLVRHYPARYTPSRILVQGGFVLGGKRQGRNKLASRPGAIVHGCRVAPTFQLQSFRPSRIRQRCQRTSQVARRIHRSHEARVARIIPFQREPLLQDD